MNALTLSAILGLILGLANSGNAEAAKRARQLQQVEQEKITALLTELQQAQGDLTNRTQP
jgi:hypothetical protein